MAPQLRWVRGGGWGGRPPARSRVSVGGGGGEWGGPFGHLATHLRERLKRHLT